QNSRFCRCLLKLLPPESVQSHGASSNQELLLAFLKSPRGIHWQQPETLQASRSRATVPASAESRLCALALLQVPGHCESCFNLHDPALCPAALNLPVRYELVQRF